MEGQGRPVSSGQAGTEGVGLRRPCQQEAWPGPTRRSHASAPHPAGEVRTWEPWQMGRDKGSFLPHSHSLLSHLSSFQHLPGCCLQQWESGKAAAALGTSVSPSVNWG